LNAGLEEERGKKGVKEKGVKKDVKNVVKKGVKKGVKKRGARVRLVLVCKFKLDIAQSRA
jgi:hypothetical protein